MTISMIFHPVANKIWLDSSIKFVEDEDREYYVIAKERLTAIAEGYPYLLPDGFRFAPLQNRKTYPFPYEIVLPDGKVVKTDNPDTAELNARIAEAAINQRYGIVSTPTAATTTTTTAAATPTPTTAVTVQDTITQTPAPTVTVPTSTTANPLQVPQDFKEIQAAEEESDEKSTLIIGGLVLVGGFLLIRQFFKKK